MEKIHEPGTVLLLTTSKNVSQRVKAEYKFMQILHRSLFIRLPPRLSWCAWPKTIDNSWWKRWKAILFPDNYQWSQISAQTSHGAMCEDSLRCFPLFYCKTPFKLWFLSSLKLLSLSLYTHPLCYLLQGCWNQRWLSHINTSEERFCFQLVLPYPRKHN